MKWKIALIASLLVINGINAISSKDIGDHAINITQFSLPFTFAFIPNDKIWLKKKALKTIRYNRYYNNDRFVKWLDYSISLGIQSIPDEVKKELPSWYIDRLNLGISNYEPDPVQSALHTFGKPAIFMAADEGISALSETETVKKAIQALPEKYGNFIVRDFVVENAQIALAGGATEVIFALANGEQQQPRKLLRKTIIHGTNEAAQQCIDVALDKSFNVVGYSGEGWIKSGTKMATKLFVLININRIVNKNL